MTQIAELVDFILANKDPAEEKAEQADPDLKHYFAGQKFCALVEKDHLPPPQRKWMESLIKIDSSSSRPEGRYWNDEEGEKKYNSHISCLHWGFVEVLCTLKKDGSVSSLTDGQIYRFLGDQKKLLNLSKGDPTFLVRGKCTPYHKESVEMPSFYTPILRDLAEEEGVMFVDTWYRAGLQTVMEDLRCFDSKIWGRDMPTIKDAGAHFAKDVNSLPELLTAREAVLRAYSRFEQMVSAGREILFKLTKIGDTK